MTLARNEADQEQLIACVRRALACIDNGEAVIPEDLCAEHPHLIRPLAEVLGLTDALSGLQQEALREDPLSGLLLAGRYQLSSCLGRGAMGVVYLAEDRELRREVAVKILDARLFRDDQAEQRFQREAEALAALQHPNVVAVYDRGRTPEGIHFLVMERLDGTTLAGLLTDIGNQAADAEPIAAVAAAMHAQPTEQHWPRLCARWACDLARGLGTAHAHALVHRDVKPSNVFLARPGRAVLLDFGIATRQSDERLTATRTTLGTPWYMAPEQVTTATSGNASPTLDVYGLGATLYHLLAGRPPYEGDAAAVLAALPNQDPPPLSKVQPDVPRDLVAIVDKCLEREPQRRYQDGDALADDLDAFLAHRPVTARPQSAMGRRLRQWRRAPARPVAVAAITLAVMIAAVAVTLWWQKQQVARQKAKMELYATVPTLLAIEGAPLERTLPELRAEHETAIVLLDQILDLDPHDLPALLRRASLHLDLDHRAAAATDMRAIANHDDNAYFHALAARYETSDANQKGVLAIDTTDLPAPTTSAQTFVAGFHELRNRHLEGYAARAERLLAQAAVDYLPARGLRLLPLAALAEKTRGEPGELLKNELYDETIALETIYGRVTARILTMRGTALLLKGDYASSIPLFERSLKLRPDRHSPHNNVAIAYRRTGDLERCQHHLQKALALRSFSWRTRYTLAQVTRDRGDLSTAYEMASALATTGAPGAAWKQPQLAGSIALAEAMSLLYSDRSASRAAAARATTHYRELIVARSTDRARSHLAVMEALAQDDVTAGLVPFAKIMLAAPLDPYVLANLAFLMPEEGLDGEQTAWLAAILRQLAAETAGGNQPLRARMQREIDQGLTEFR